MTTAPLRQVMIVRLRQEVNDKCQKDSKSSHWLARKNERYPRAKCMAGAYDTIQLLLRPTNHSLLAPKAPQSFPQATWRLLEIIGID